MGIFNIPKSIIKKIENEIEELFTKLKYKLFGTNNPSQNPSIPPRLSLPGIYESAAQEEHVSPNWDLYQTVSKVSSSYIDSVKEKTKAQLINNLQSVIAKGKGEAEKQIQIIINDTWQDTSNAIKTIIGTETTKAKNLGFLTGIVKANEAVNIDDPVVYFVIVQDKDLCDECKDLHLLEDNKTPRLWYLSEVGFGYHKKGEPNPKIGGLHPHCRCALTTLMPGYGFTAAGKVTFIKLKHNEIMEQRPFSLTKKELDPSLGYTIEHEISYDQFNNPELWVYAKSPDNKTIGTAWFIHKGNKYIYPMDIYVQKDHRRKGLASALYRHAENISKKKIIPGVQTASGKSLWASKDRKFGT